MMAIAPEISRTVVCLTKNQKVKSKEQSYPREKNFQLKCEYERTGTVYLVEKEFFLMNMHSSSALILDST